MPRKRKGHVNTSAVVDVVADKADESDHSGDLVIALDNCNCDIEPQSTEVNEEDDYFYNHLTDDVRKELGAIKLNWFEDAILDSSSQIPSGQSDLTIQESPSGKSLSPISSPFGIDWCSGTTSLSKNCNHSTPTPENVAISLGASMGGHDLSWTSSMATPVVDEALKSSVDDEGITDDSMVICITSTSNNESDQSVIPSRSMANDHNPKLNEQEFKMPSENLKPTEASLNLSASIPFVAGPSRNSLEIERSTEGNSVSNGLTTPKIQKSGLSRTSLPRRRMRDLRFNENEESRDGDIEITMEIKTNPQSDNIVNSPKSVSEASSVDYVSAISSATNFVTVSAPGIQVSTTSAEFQDEIQNDNNEDDHVICSSEIPAILNSLIDNVQKETLQNMKKFEDVNAINVLGVDHDYFKPISVGTRIVNDSFSECDSQKMNGVSQLMEVVDCTAACLESIRDDQFSNHKKESIVNAGHRDDQSNNEEFVVSNLEDNLQKTRRVNKGIDDVSVKVQDEFFWDPDFPDVELISSQVKNMESRSTSKHLTNQHVDSMSISKVSIQATPNNLQGFISASGKLITISDDAIHKANEMFKVESLDAGSDIVQKAMAACFQEEDLSLISQTDGDEQLQKSTDLISLKETREKTNTNIFQGGFVSASGKIIKISDKAMQKAKELFVAESFDTSLTNEGPTDETGEFNLIEKSDLINEMMATNDEKPQKQTDLSFTNIASVKPDLNVGTYQGFVSASGREITISDKALQKAKELFEAESGDLRDDKRLVSFSANEPRGISPTIEELEDNLEAVSSCSTNEALSETIRRDLVSTPEPPTKAIDGLVENVAAFRGFSMASGKAITISKDALESARRMLDVDSLISTNKLLNNVEESFQGFSTGSVKACKVSARAKAGYENHLAKVMVELPQMSVCGPTGDSRGVKRHLDNDDDVQVDERLSKLQATEASQEKSAIVADDEATSAMDLSDDSHEKSMVVADDEVTGAMDVSEDSLNAAQALIAMANASWEESPDDTIAEEELNGDEIKAAVTPGMTEVETEMKSNQNTSLNDMSTEVLESTFALLEDEFHSDVSKAGGSFTAWESPVNKKEADANKSVCIAHQNISKLPSTSCVSKKSDQVIYNNERLRPDIADGELKVSSKRKTFIDDQLGRIAHKSKLKILPSIGTIFEARNNDKHARLTLRHFFNGKPRSLPFNEAVKCGVKISTLNVRSRNAAEFRFSFADHFKEVCSSDDVGMVLLESGTKLILGQDNSAGKEEFYRALMDCSGVDPKLVNRDWVTNHYRWIVWKLAAMEVSFPNKCVGRCLTPSRVFSELRYRVNCEIDSSRRSALKKIAERDDTPLKSIVLCVADIVHPDHNVGNESGNETFDDSITKNSVHLELSDGWYSMKAIMDDPLTYVVERGEIFVGQKLVIHGMDIVGSTEACSPLDIKSNQFLKLSYNCCRRARWDAKLGYLRCPRPFPLPLNSFRSDGGPIGLVDVVIARVYPLQYLEKRSDGSSFVCNAKLNDLANKQAEIQKCALMDRLYNDAQSRFEQEELHHTRKKRVSATKKINVNELKLLVSGEEIAEALQNAADPAFFESCLSSTQKESLVKHDLAANELRRAQLQAELSKVMQSKKDDGEFPMDRNVVSFLKIRVAGIHPMDVREKTTSMLTLWRPSEDVNGLLEEGKCMRIYYVMAERRCNGRELLVKSTKMTKFEEKKDATDDFVAAVYKPRDFISFDQISSPDFQPLYGEVDIVGVVLSTETVSQMHCGKMDIVYMANENQDVVGIKFIGGLEAFGVEGVLEPAAFVIGCNLRWSGRDRSPIPCVHMLEISTFRRNPKNDRAKRLINNLRGSIKELKSFIEEAKKNISTVLENDSNFQSASPLNRPNRPGQPKFASTPLSNNLRPPFQSKNVTMSTSIEEEEEGDESSHQPSMEPTKTSLGDQTLSRMKRLQRYIGTPPQLSAIASPNAPSVSTKYKVPLTKHGHSTTSK